MWEWSDDPNMVALWFHILLEANYEPKNWRGLTIARGQLVFGLEAWVEKTGISRQSLRTCILRLKSTGELTGKSTNKFTVLTIVKYEEYQCNDSELTGKSTGNLTYEQHSTNIPSTAPKEVKKERKKNITPIVPLPDWLNEKAWQDLLSYRGNKFTYRAKELSIMKLDKLRANGNKPEDVINQTIMNGYKGLFAVKKDYHEKTKPSTAKPSEKQRTVNAYADIITKRNAEANKGLSGEPEPTDDPSGTVLSDTKGLW